MEKEQNSEIEEKINNKTKSSEESKNSENKNESNISPEDRIKELEDKLARTLAEMENQRRRYEKEKDDALNSKDENSPNNTDNNPPTIENNTIF